MTLYLNPPFPHPYCSQATGTSFWSLNAPSMVSPLGFCLNILITKNVLPLYHMIYLFCLIKFQIKVNFSWKILHGHLLCSTTFISLITCHFDYLHIFLYIVCLYPLQYNLHKAGFLCLLLCIELSLPSELSAIDGCSISILNDKL